MALFRSLLVLLCLTSVSSCPDEELCAYEDCGSCGNACCRLDFAVSETASEAMLLLNASLLSGGADGRYTAQFTAEGVTGFADLRPYNHDADYIGQAIHTTYSPYYYNDSISITINPPTDDVNTTVIRAFSYSLIAGAYCDNGQNYYNIVNLIQSIDWAKGFIISGDGSCPPPPAARKTGSVVSSSPPPPSSLQTIS
jgi:hypothetical protein